jgi:uncharacterized protein (DUF58 family)
MLADALTTPGVALDPQALLRLRHLAWRGRTSITRQLSTLPGGLVTRRRGRGVEVDDVRLWADGDDVRHIDRNTTARTGVLHVRTFRDERERRVLLVPDFRPPMLFGTRRALRSVAAAEALTILGWRVIANGGRIGLLSAGEGEAVYVRPRAGEKAMAAVIGGLARAHAAALQGARRSDPPLAETLEAAARAMPQGGQIVLASALDAVGAGFDEAVLALRGRVGLRAILVLDAFEQRPPAGVYPFAARAGGLRWGRILPAQVADTGALRLKRLADLGARGVLLDSESEPEAMVPLVEQLDDFDR